MRSEPRPLPQLPKRDKLAQAPVRQGRPPLPPELFDTLADILADALVASYLRAHAADPGRSEQDRDALDNADRHAYKLEP